MMSRILLACLLLDLCLAYIRSFNRVSVLNPLVDFTTYENIARLDSNTMTSYFRNQGTTSLRMGVPGNQDLQTSFVSRLKSITDEKEFANFLKTSAHKRVSLSSSDRSMLVDELQHRVPFMSVHSASDVLWSLGTLKIPRSLDNMSAVIALLLERLDASQLAMTRDNMALALVGLARLGIKCPNPNRPNSFLEALPRTLVLMDSMQVANCMWALGKYGITWDSLTLKVQKAYKAAITRVGPKMSPLAVANTIHGLSNQRARWGMLPSYLTESLSSALEGTVRGMQEQEVSNCISGLGRLGTEWTDLSPTIRRLLGDAFLRTIGDLPPRGLAMSIHGLGRMNADFTSLPPSFRSNIVSAITKISPKLNSLEVSNVLYGLGKMGTSFSDKVNIKSEIEASVSTIVSKAGSFAIPGLAMKGVSGEELDISIAGSRGKGRGQYVGRGFESDSTSAVTGLPDKARDSILTAFQRAAGQMNAQGIANSLWGLMLMEAQWCDISPSLHNSILKVVQREAAKMTEQELCNTVYALGRVGVSWSDLPLEVRKQALTTIEITAPLMAPAGLVMALLGLGRMHLMWSDMPPSLVSALGGAVERVLSSASERTLAGLVHALAMVGAQWGDLELALQTALLLGISRSQGELKEDEQKPLVPLVSAAPVSIKGAVDSQSLGGTDAFIPKGRSPTRASRAAFGEKAAGARKLSVKTVRYSAPPASKGSPAPVRPISEGSSSQKQTKTQSQPLQSRLPATKSQPKVPKALCTKVLLLQQKSSRTAAALLLSPPSPLAPSALKAIQEMISPPNLDSQSFRLLVESQLAPLESPLISYLHWPEAEFPIQPVAASKASKTKAKTNKNVNAPINDSKLTKGQKRKRKQIEGKKEEVKANGKKWIPTKDITVLEVGKLSPPLPLAPSSVLMKEKVSSSASRGDSAVAGNHLVYSLGQMGASWDQLGPEIRATLSDSLSMSLPLMGEMGVVNSLHGLTSLGAKWRELRGDIQVAFQESLQRVSDDMGEQGVSVTVLSLSKLDVCWAEDLTEQAKSALVKAIIRQAQIGEHALSSLLYGLGKLSRTWADLNPDVRQTLKEAIVVGHLNDRCTPQGVANSLHGLAQMHATWGILSSSVRLALFAEVNKVVPLATETQLSNIVGSLGKMGLQWEVLPEQLKSKMISAITAKAQTSNEWHLSTILFSLGSMGLNWKALPDTLRTNFIHALERVNAERGILTNSVDEYPLGGAAEVGLEERKSWSKGQKVSTVDFDDVLPVVDYIMRKEIKVVMPMHNSSYTERLGLELDCWSIFSKCYRIPNPYPRLTLNLSQTLTDRKKALQMNAQGVSMTVVGMSRLAATYILLPDSLVASMSLSLQGACPSMNCAQVAASVSGLSKAQWRWDGLTLGLKSELLIAIGRTASKATTLDMAILMNGLGTMGVRWSQLPSEIRGALQRGIERTACNGAADEVAGATFGLGLMEVSWETLPLDLRRALADGILRVTGACDTVRASYLPLSPTRNYSEIDSSNASPYAGSGITGAARFAAASSSPVPASGYRSSRVPASTLRRHYEDESEASWLMTPASDKPSRERAGRTESDVRERQQGQGISPQALANLMYALSLLVFDTQREEVHEELSLVHIALLDSISDVRVVGGRFSEAEREQILIYTSTLQTLTPLNNFVTQRSKCLLRADRPFQKPSQLQKGVVCALTEALRRKNADFEVMDEYSAFNGAFPVDATIFEGDQLVAFVEVDGPQHYRADGRLRRKDIMKEALYRGKYPGASFTRVRFDQVNRLGSGYVGAQVANFISTTAPIRVRCVPQGESNSPSFFPLFSMAETQKSCSVVYRECEEDGLAIRRAKRALLQALSIHTKGPTRASMYDNVHSHAYYLSQLTSHVNSN